MGRLREGAGFKIMVFNFLTVNFSLHWVMYQPGPSTRAVF